MDTPLLQEMIGSALVLTINRPEKRNALSGGVANALMEAIEKANSNNSIRSVILRGAGTSAFSSGADLKERAAANADEKWQLSRRLFEINHSMLMSPKIFFAAIAGWCLGGGLELALSCDFRVSERSGVFGWPEVKLGAYPGAGAAVILPRILGVQRAKSFLLSTANIDSKKALEIGLVDYLAEEKSASDLCIELARELESIAPRAQGAIKASIRSTAGMPLDEAFSVDAEFRRPLESTIDYSEGIKAFFEKRKPNFIGS
jgi:enoyl-CoA hydratase/carnithine racemase